jgi:CRISPR/Cas system-associated exonuclease Cas4 (RecB family)
VTTASTAADKPAPGQVDRQLSISWSRLKDQEECSEKAWLLQRGFRSRVTDVRIYFKGTVVDRCMRKWLDQEKPQPGWMAEMVDLILEESLVETKDSGDGAVGWKHPKDKDEVREWCRTCVTKLEPVLYQYAIPYNYQPAVRFKVPLTIPYLDGSPQRIWLNGEMDLLTSEPLPDGGIDIPRSLHRYRVWDLKATENENYHKKMLGQLIFYDLVVRIMMGAYPVEVGIIQPMCQVPVVPMSLTTDHRNEMAARIIRVAEQQWNGHHRPKESNTGCNWCPVQHACPKFLVAGRGKAPLA